MSRISEVQERYKSFRIWIEEKEYAYSHTHLYEWNEFLKIGVLSYYNKDDQ